MSTIRKEFKKGELVRFSNEEKYANTKELAILDGIVLDREGDFSHLIKITKRIEVGCDFDILHEPKVGKIISLGNYYLSKRSSLIKVYRRKNA